MSLLNYKPLSYRTRADMFAHLAAMEKAGLPAAKAFAILKLPKGAQARLKQACKLIERGGSPALACEKYGVFSRFEANLLRAALNAGSPTFTYQRLADTYARKALQVQAIKSRLMPPGAILVIAFILQPLPALVTGSLSIGGYLAKCLLPLFAIAAVIMLAGRLHAWFELGKPTAVRTWIEHLLLRTPVFGAIFQRRCSRDFFESLALLLEAGVPMFEALPPALETIDFSVIKQSYASIKKNIMNGATLASTITGVAYMPDTQVRAFIETGESSGTLPEMLFRYANAETESINQLQQQITEWLPRLAYAVIAGWVAYSILGSHAFLPNLPEELR